MPAAWSPGNKNCVLQWHTPCAGFAARVPCPLARTKNDAAGPSSKPVPLHSLPDCGDGNQLLLRRIHAQQRKHGLRSEFMEETADGPPTNKKTCQNAPYLES